MISQNVEAQVQQGSMLRPNRSRSFMENAFARALKTAVKNSTVALILLFGLRQGNECLCQAARGQRSLTTLLELAVNIRPRCLELLCGQLRPIGGLVGDVNLINGLFDILQGQLPISQMHFYAPRRMSPSFSAFGMGSVGVEFHHQSR